MDDENTLKKLFDDAGLALEEYREKREARRARRLEEMLAEIPADLRQYILEIYEEDGEFILVIPECETIFCYYSGVLKRRFGVSNLFDTDNLLLAIGFAHELFGKLGGKTKTIKPAKPNRFKDQGIIALMLAQLKRQGRKPPRLEG